ncbi:MAG TPA: hypothetical protein VH988_27345 [Thermoanaerobaculia bacterium]|jgi:hypothetical protein|nr:hypothetical protein [Thermoanaerobaculia bacterium]
MSTTGWTGTRIENHYGESLDFYVSTSPNGASPAVLNMSNGGDIIYNSGLTLFQIQPATSSTEVPQTASGWTGTYISNQLNDSVTLIVSVNPNGASPVQILVPAKTSFVFNSGVTLFNVTQA